MPAKRILVGDDEPGMRRASFEALTRRGHAVDLAENGAEALEKFKSQHFDLVIIGDTLAALQEIKRTSPQTPVVVLSGHGTVEKAVEVMREGAFDYILKTLWLDLIEETLERAFKHAPASVQPHTDNGHRPIITESPAMKRLLEIARSVAPSPATVLLQGESGTGKELLARFIHRNSDRAGGPFVAVNCASLPEGLLESELFGHEKGSFTGAVARKIGKFELADQGTLLLDEISEMSLPLQAKLLRVLQEGEIDRVGGRSPVKIDARVIATTNRHIKDWVNQGKFRPDLYYRLNVIPLTIPPLRDRPGDIPCLAAYFLEKYAALNGKDKKFQAKTARHRLDLETWPGNVRELENIIARGVLLSAGPEVDAADLFMEDAGPTPPWEGTTKESAPKEVMTIRDMEKGLIHRALIETDGNRTHAAKILGISVRTLRNKLAEYKNLGLEAGGVG
ncbi:MAG: sigma-54 dependent transcriptional regulator [Pseudomonadota bacterium]